MAEDYKLLQLRASDYKDDYGNTWCDATFQGVGEPVKWVMKDPTKPNLGDSYYGEVKERESRAGKPYLRFYAKQKEDTPGTPENASKEDSIHRSVALQQAVLANKDGRTNTILDDADKFYAWLTKTEIKEEPHETPLKKQEEKIDEVFGPNTYD